MGENPVLWEDVEDYNGLWYPVCVVGNSAVIAYCEKEYDRLKAMHGRKLWYLVPTAQLVQHSNLRTYIGDSWSQG